MKSRSESAADNDRALVTIIHTAAQRNLIAAALISDLVGMGDAAAVAVDPGGADGVVALVNTSHHALVIARPLGEVGDPAAAHGGHDIGDVGEGCGAGQGAPDRGRCRQGAGQGSTQHHDAQKQGNNLLHIVGLLPYLVLAFFAHLC